MMIDSDLLKQFFGTGNNETDDRNNLDFSKKVNSAEKALKASVATGYRGKKKICRISFLGIYFIF